MSDAGVLKGNPETTGTSVAGGTETHRPAAHGPSAGYGDNVEKDDRSARQALKDSGKGVTGILAGIHGVGEKIRGTVNAGIDDTFQEVCYPFLFCSKKVDADGFQGFNQRSEDGCIRRSRNWNRPFLAADEGPRGWRKATRASEYGFE